MFPGRLAEEATGIAETFPIDEFATVLPSLIGDGDSVYVVREGGNLYQPPGLGETPRTQRRQLEDAIARLLSPRTVLDATPAVEQMRLVKDQHEIGALRRASEISAIGLVELMKSIRPGMNDLEPPDYSSTCGSGRCEGSGAPCRPRSD